MTDIQKILDSAPDMFSVIFSSDDPLRAQKSFFLTRLYAATEMFCTGSEHFKEMFMIDALYLDGELFVLCPPPPDEQKNLLDELEKDDLIKKIIITTNGEEKYGCTGNKHTLLRRYIESGIQEGKTTTGSEEADKVIKELITNVKESIISVLKNKKQTFH